MTELQEKYATQNLAQGYSEADPFTRERYVQFHHFMPKHARSILDVGANTGRAGVTATAAPSARRNETVITMRSDTA